MIMFKNLSISVALTAFLMSTNVFAGLVLEKYSGGANSTYGGFSMTDFDYSKAFTGYGELTNTVSSPLSGSLRFVDSNGDDLSLGHYTTESADTNDSNNDSNDSGDLHWWKSSEEGSNYDIYTTQEHWVTMLLPEDTYAFSFNVGANKNARGWLMADAFDGSEISRTDNFSINPNNSPGFAIYSDAQSCSAIKSITVEPPFLWGLGNFSIHQDKNRCGTVPEPSILALLSFGLIGVGLARRRMKK